MVTLNQINFSTSSSDIFQCDICHSELGINSLNLSLSHSTAEGTGKTLICNTCVGEVNQ